MSKNRVKVFSAFMFTALLSLMLASGKLAPNKVYAYSEGPPPGYTGAPGESVCTACHNTAALNSGPGSVAIQLPTDTYALGQTYQIVVHDTTSDQSRRRWGFELTVLNGKNQPAGKLTVTDSAHTQIKSGGLVPNRRYIEQTLDGTFSGQTGGATWTFNWQAPAKNVGAVTFYVASNFSAGCGTDQCGEIHTATASVAAPPIVEPPPPAILNAAVSGKSLSVMGTGFDAKCVLMVNGKAVTTKFDPASPSLLTSPKGGKKIAIGDTVTLVVQDNGSNEQSAPFTFTRTE